MLQLRHINAADARQMRAYRLQMKERLYRFNFVRVSLPLLSPRLLTVFSRPFSSLLPRSRPLIFVRVSQEVLMQLDKEERQAKLEETFQSRSEEQRLNSSHSGESRMPSSA